MSPCRSEADAERAEREKERQERTREAEEAKRAEEEKAEEAKKALEGCKGKTADEALEIAKAADCRIYFKDLRGVDVTYLVMSENDSQAHGAAVLDVELAKELFAGSTVTFKIDFTDQQALEEAARKEAGGMPDVVGKTAAEAIDAANSLGRGYSFKDPRGNGISKADHPAYGPARARAIVTSVEDSVGKSNNLVFTLDRTLAITREDSPEFAAVLDSNDEYASNIVEFANSREGLNVEFDGYVAYLAPHGNYDTRFDILIYVGSAGDLIGPRFKFEDVNLSYDLHWYGNQPDYLEQDMNLHIIAKVRGWGAGDLFMIEPVATSLR